MLWDTFTCTFRGHVIACTSRKNKNRKLIEKTINPSISDDLLSALENKQLELDIMIEDRASRNYYHKRAKWMEQNRKLHNIVSETPAEEFFPKEKKNH